jgi:hypothetical protein
MKMMMMRGRGLQHTMMGVAVTWMCVACLSPGARAADYGAFGFAGTSASGGTPVTHETFGEDERLLDAYSASTIGSLSNGAAATYHGSLFNGIAGTLSHSHRPGLDTWEGTASASSRVEIFDRLTFTIPAGEYPDDIYAVLHGDYDGYLGAAGNYGTSVSQTIEVYLGYERFYEYILDHGDEGNDGFYSDEFTLSTKLLNGGQVLATPLETPRQVSAYLYTVANTPGYVEDSAEIADSDFASTLRILSIEVPEGVTWTSSSGVFLAAPEPGRGSLLLAGFGALIVLARVPRARRNRGGARVAGNGA